ncbi:hypothetical protein BSN85_11990 [Bradyrhizobium brasilense]|uniref:phosphotriesterase family protein n=1 Tax=Bradyrhizobium brasilense TaxID=1419277 RepID=UPI0009780AD1|nr:hypothetical protein [Bradyrhizobium brasilense]OMI11595.1 hypothetical protein BSN85_11990 [Bradyrhizobium brasilense]
MKEVSKKSGVQIVCTTGFYHEEGECRRYCRFCSVDKIADFYIRGIMRGFGNTGLKAGAAK